MRPGLELIQRGHDFGDRSKAAFDNVHFARLDRGALDFNGREAVGGVVVMRYGENPRAVIERVKTKIAALESELDGIKIHAVYDRTLLIDETVTTLTDALGHELLITIAVIVLFLLHVRASIVIAITLPMAVLMSFQAW